MTETHLTFPIDQLLEQKTTLLLTEIAEADDATFYAKRLGFVIEELAEAGVEHFFVKAVEIAEVGTVLKTLINTGIASAQKTMLAVIKRVMKRSSHEQIQSYASYIDQLMIQLTFEE